MANSSSTDNQDLDLGQLSKKVKNYFSRFNDAIFDGILFIKRNSIILIILIILGAGLGYYKDKTSAVYEQKIFVIPNFGSVDYLYEEIKYLSSKIKLQDAEFIKTAGKIDIEKFSKIEIKPVVEIYDFIEDKDIDEDDRKFQLFKLISENGDMTKVLKDNTTAKYYKNHIITISTNGEVNKSEVVTPIMRYLNSNLYYLSMKDHYAKNLDAKIAANDTMIKQIDAIINDFSSRGKTSNMVYYNDNTDLSLLIKQKNRLVKELGQTKIDRANADNVIKETSVVLNVGSTSLLVGMMKIIVPILFVISFVIGVKFRDFYRYQVNKRKTIISA